MSEVTVGILALQGDVEEHVAATEKAAKKLDVDGKTILVKSVDDLRKIGALIIPGGESTVMGSLSSVKGIMPTLREKINSGLPTLATCAGLIMLAKKAEDKVVGETRQPLIGTLDVAVERNSFGRQRESFEANLTIGLPRAGQFHGVFIRAPTFKSLGQGVKELARLDDVVVAVRQGNMIATAFHPELGEDTFFHEYLINLTRDRDREN